MNYVYCSSKYAVSANIARYVAQVFGAKILWDNGIIDTNDEIETYIVVNGVPVFSPGTVFDRVGEAMMEAKRLIWVQNDYKIKVPKGSNRANSPYRTAFSDRVRMGRSGVEYWTTIREFGHHYVNWNALSFHPDAPHKSMDERKFGDEVVYFGNMRDKRIPYFDRYFRNPSTIIHLVSSNFKFFDRYAAGKLRHSTFLERDNIQEIIQEFGLGLYLEDPASHDQFMSPACRFYEMLSARVPMVFQPEALTTFSTAEYNISSFIADSVDLPDKLADREEILAEQENQWFERAYAERMKLHDTINRLANSH